MVLASPWRVLWARTRGAPLLLVHRLYVDEGHRGVVLFRAQ